MIELIIYDFDGVMTDNKVIIDQNGNESVIVNRSDGLAISEFKKYNIRQIIISTERNPVVQKRAEKLNIPCLNSVENKKSVVEDFLLKNGINNQNVVYVGNDINDLDAMLIVGFPVAPADAHGSVKKISRYITNSIGGFGVVRDLLDILKNDKLIHDFEKK
jgi:3-deoxy-D-manno-octulosonate 8-phosphate phosphatase (KDO 8-P phosphatase)